jgi:HlyD family secretion protein
MKTKKKTMYLASGAGALLVATSALGAYAWQQKDDPAVHGPLVEVQRGNITETAAASGKITPDVQVEVKSRASGQVVEVLVKEGDTVESGQLLVHLDPTDATRQLAEAKLARRRVQADLEAARATLAVAELEAKNDAITSTVAKQSSDLGLGSNDAARAAEHAAHVADANVKLRRAQLSAAQGQLESADLSVQDAELRLKETSIYAPISGTVLDVAVEKGTLVSSALTNVSGGSAVMTLADLSDLRIVASVDEAQISRVQPGQRAEISVDTYGDRVFRGVVERVSPLGVDTSSVVTFDVEIAVVDAASEMLRSGMSADIEIVTAEQQGALLVPLLAVQSQGKRRFVKLATGEERSIETGATDGTRMVVLKGLEEGDDVLASAPAPKAVASQRPSQGPLPGMNMGAARGGRSR